MNNPHTSAPAQKVEAAVGSDSRHTHPDWTVEAAAGTLPAPVLAPVSVVDILNTAAVDAMVAAAEGNHRIVVDTTVKEGVGQHSAVHNRKADLEALVVLMEVPRVQEKG